MVVTREMVLYTQDHQSRLRDLMDYQPMFNSIARYEVTSDRLTPTSCIHSSSVSHPIVSNSSLLGPTFPAESGRIALHPRVIDLDSTFGRTNVKFKATKLMEIDDTPSVVYIGSSVDSPGVVPATAARGKPVWGQQMEFSAA